MKKSTKKPRRAGRRRRGNEAGTPQGAAADGHGCGYCRFATERIMRMDRRIEDKEYPNSGTSAREATATRSSVSA